MFDRKLIALAGKPPGRLRLAALVAALCLCLFAAIAPALAQTSQPRTVTFLSADGKTNLVGYLFPPAGKPKTAPAVVLMHGRSGAYSSLAKGNYSSVTIEKRIRQWAELWSQQGYWALVVDSFGPRGYPAGFAAGSDASRPAAVNEVTVRPLDAYGALRYLRQSPRVRPDRIALQGWSNGGSAALASMSPQALSDGTTDHARGFRVALALYPGCGLQNHFKDGYLPYAPVHIFIGTRDEEVSTTACEKLASATKAAGGDIAITVFEAATHDFDDPGRERQSVPANVSAASETRRQAIALFTAALGH
jgi:carboxymethylenebutenolidase